MFAKLHTWMRGSASQLGAAARSFRRNSRGMAAIEMAFVFPFMVVLYIGLVDVTNMISASRKVTITASTLADLVTQTSMTITSSTIDGFFNAISPIVEPYPASQVRAEIFAYRKNGSNVNLIWRKTNGGTCGPAPVTTGLINLMTDNNDLISARVCYNYTPLFSMVFGINPFKTEHLLTLRPRESRTLDCTGCPTS
jgi:Flp pilus assembly protein TadG